MSKIVECVPNYSISKDKEGLEKILDCFRGKEDVKLLDYSSDKDHNRSVITISGEPSAVKNALLESVKVSLKLIDLRKHKGEHPRMGALDVAPFIPIRNMDIKEAVDLSKEFGEELGFLGIPVYLYEKSASSPKRKNLANVRRGEFEGLKEKMLNDGWKPDFGPEKPHESFGAVAVGARMPLVAFNVNLSTNDVSIATEISKKVRHLGGGLRYVKAMGVYLKERDLAQVSMNLTDYTKTSIYRAVEMIRFEAKRYGVSIVGTELIGLIPEDALFDSAAYYLQIENFNTNQILEKKIFE